MAAHNPQKIWNKHSEQWRDPASVINQNESFPSIDHNLLQCEISGNLWNVLEKLNIRLLISREYEHLLIALGVSKKSSEVSYMSLPHPSGIAVDRTKNIVHIASTRNPNQVYSFSPVNNFISRTDIKFENKITSSDHSTLMPAQLRFYPGSLYIHDLAMIGRKLCANAVGHNAVVELLDHGHYKYLWWPKCAEKNNKPRTDANYLQLNSIASGKSISDSFFSASTDTCSSIRPGHMDFKVDGRGVIFSGKTREVICRGLTRPHSARLYQNKIWVDNSGYGEFGYVEGQKFHPIIKLPGWTRGLAFFNGIAFIGTSRVLPKFTHYAPGLNVEKSICAIHALELQSGKILGSIEWPLGNQIFAIDWIPSKVSKGFIFDYLPKKRTEHIKHLAYSFSKHTRRKV